MRIAQIAPIAERVPPKKYGGTERVIYHLTEELVRLGHEVTLFASGDSRTSGKLVSVVPRSLREMSEKDIYGFNHHSMLNVGLAYSMQDQFDIIHDHNPHMGLPTANISETPVVTTWHGPYNREISRYFGLLNRTHLVSISKSQAALAHDLKFVGNVYNGLDMKRYPFSDTPKDYMLFVGRIDAEKGVHLACDTAVRLGKKLVIAAKLDDQVPHIREYFEKEIRPRFEARPDLLQWIGEVDEASRNELMKNALCLLHAVTWPEPFGLTLIESMACGCPVIAFNRGSIPEVIVDGKTGFVVENVDQMVRAVKKIAAIDRAYCRKYSIETFSATRMARGYEAIYKKVVDAKRRGQSRPQNQEESINDSKRQKLFLGFGSSGNQTA
ncbi:MAG TPA: glycosyltransferase family 4 protein [Patescibacteria group bacterium]|nr:glycosyltransferase family 4 protein [Patescibacteria group bacterium]